MHKYAKTISIIVILFLGCDEIENKIKNTTDELKPLTITKNEIKKTEINRLSSVIKKQKYFSDVFKSIDTISLEQTSESRISRPYRVRVSKKYFILIDSPISSNFVLAFSRKDGKFVGRFGGNGNGPGEYVRPNQIEIIENELFIYDNKHRRISVFNLDSRELQREWKVNRLYNAVTAIDKKLIFLNEYNYGYIEDIQIYDIYGKLVKTSSLPKPTKPEIQRSFFPGSSFYMTKSNDAIVYVGADEYRLVLGKILSKEEHFWGNANPPKSIRILNFPESDRDPGWRWFKNNYPLCYGLFTLNNGLIFVELSDYLHVYTYEGNYITALKNYSHKNIFTTDGEQIFEFTENYLSETEEIFNPRVIVHELRLNDK